MSLFQKLTTTVPVIGKTMVNWYSPFRGAGIRSDIYDLKGGYIRVYMPLTRQNRNVVGTHFGGSLYAMVDPFYMLILIYQLGDDYIVWDKAAKIDFLAPGRTTVYADIRISPDEIADIRRLAADHSPVLRTYQLNILDERGQRIAAVEKVVYIRRKKPKADLSVH